MRKLLISLLILIPLFGKSQSSYQLIGSISDTFDVSASSWLHTDSAQYLYNIDTLLVTWNQLILDPDTGWISNRTSFYSYDELKNDTSEIIQQFDSYTQLFVNQTKILRTYDSNHLVLNTNIQLWDLLNQQWINSTLISNSYDANSNLQKQVYFGWNSVTLMWDSTQKFLYAYDVNNNKISETISGGYQTLYNQFLTNFYYNNANLDTLSIRQIWNSNNSSWKKNGGYQDTLTYDANNNLASTTRWNYNSSSHKYDQSYAKTEYEYNADNIVSLRHDYNGDGASNFNPTANYIYQYNEDGNADTTTIQIYDASNSEFKNYQQQRFYYTASDSLTAINDAPDNSYRFKLFPNPVQESIELITTQDVSSSIQLYVYDIDGKNFINKNISLHKGENTIKLNTEILPQGIYFIKVVNKSNKAQCINRFIKQ